MDFMLLWILCYYGFYDFIGRFLFFFLWKGGEVVTIFFFSKTRVVLGASLRVCPFFVLFYFLKGRALVIG